MSSPPDDDWSLFARVRREPGALDQLFRRHRDLVFRVAYARCGNESDANDITQEVFLQLANHRRPILRRARFTTWLYRVAANTATDAWRRRQRRAETGLDHFLEPSAPGDAEARQELEQVLNLVATLPERQKQVFELRILEQWSLEETAAALGVSSGSVKTHLHRALGAVRKQLEDE